LRIIFFPSHIGNHDDQVNLESILRSFDIDPVEYEAFVLSAGSMKKEEDGNNLESD